MLAAAAANERPRPCAPPNGGGVLPINRGESAYDDELETDVAAGEDRCELPSSGPARELWTELALSGERSLRPALTSSSSFSSSRSPLASRSASRASRSRPSRSSSRSRCFRSSAVTRTAPPSRRDCLTLTLTPRGPPAAVRADDALADVRWRDVAAPGVIEGGRAARKVAVAFVVIVGSPSIDRSGDEASDEVE